VSYARKVVESKSFHENGILAVRPKWCGEGLQSPSAFSRWSADRPVSAKWPPGVQKRMERPAAEPGVIGAAASAKGESGGNRMVETNSGKRYACSALRHRHRGVAVQ
jgi:hypothetical protein